MLQFIKRLSTITLGIITLFIILILVFASKQTDQKRLLFSQEEKIIDMFGVSVQSKKSTVNDINIPIHIGNGSYQLKKPHGTKGKLISWSQYGQDIYIDKLLNEKKNGFFVEIGGFDGESFSNTLLLEKKRNWSGLLVEANPYTYELMVEKDRRCYMLNGCISSTVSNMTFIVGGALTSVRDITPKRHKKRIDNDAILYAKENTWRHAKENVVVKCFSLLSILKFIGYTHINYFSLDVEGAELIILNSIDWNQLQIDVFTIETDQHRDQIISFMKLKRFKWIKKLSGDDVFIRTDN